MGLNSPDEILFVCSQTLFELVGMKNECGDE